MTSATLEKTEVQCGQHEKWVTDWSYYVGEERLGNVRFSKTRFGMHKSYHEDGRHLVMSLDLEPCIDMTYWHLKWERDGYDGYQASFDGVVGGKL
jgi:hypothetical protein